MTDPTQKRNGPPPKSARPQNTRRTAPHSAASRQRQAAARRKAAILRRKRVRRQKMILGGILALLLLLVTVFTFSTCSKKDRPAVSAGSSNVQDDSSTKGGETSKSGTDGEKEAAPTPVPPKPVSLTVSVVGDCTLGTDEAFDYSTSLNAYFDSYGSSYFLENVKPVFSADDLTIANFEGVLTESDAREDKMFAFKAPASFADILTDGSVEAVTTANNHSHDYGEQSYIDTQNTLDSKGVVHFGYDRTAVVDVKGVKVGLVGIYELYDHLERTQQLKDNIAKVKAEGAQLVIVILHWGNEKEEVPDSNQMTLGRLAIDEGADLVCGHHPHVLQGIETYKGKNIVYSLGNFCFGGNSAPSDMDSMIYQQTFTITGDEVKADNVTNVIPCSISSDYGYNNYQPTPAEGSEAERILQKINERSSWIDTAEPQNKTWGPQEDTTVPADTGTDDTDSESIEQS